MNPTSQNDTAAAERTRTPKPYSAHYHLNNFIFLFLMAIFLIAVYTFVLQKNYSDRTLDAAVERNVACSDAIHQLVSNKFTREDYTQINSRADMDTSRYKALQTNLNEIRSLNSTRYLYTAKRDDNGRLIYLVDGLDLGASDFAYPGTYIEEEMIPYIERALSGETVYSQEIVDTTWGHIFTACYPIVANDGSNDIVGALCIEMDMESTYSLLKSCSDMTIHAEVVAVLIAILLLITVYLSFQKRRKEQHKQQQILRESAAAADAANKAKSTFLFNMSHDIRTPMNAVIGYTELAEKHLKEPERLQEYVKNIRVCGQKLLSILDNVLELARIENNKVTIENDVAKVEDGLDSCLVMFHTSLEERQQSLTVSKEIQYPYIYIDNAHMCEIVLNIMSNAIKYTGVGGSIHCGLRQFPSERDGWCITEVSITDNGIGMSEEFQKHIFESFSRERNSTISGVDGTGLGMGIVKKLVDLMGGTIEIKSKLGKGSTFTVRIPSRIAKQEDIQPKHAEVCHLNQEEIANTRILLAEDNDINAEIAMELLQEEGLTVEHAVNGVNCIEMLEKAPSNYYSLILMDIQMPVMDGYTATQNIRKLDDISKRKIPIIAMTANAFAEDRQKALSVGMNDHVAKPIDMNTLIPVLQKYLHK